MGKAKMLGFSKPLPHNSRQGNKAPWQGGKKKIIPPKKNTCVCCDVIIPEGRQVCPRCEHEKRIDKEVMFMPEPPNQELSRGDLVRRMDDQQLAQYLYSLTNRDFELQFCQNKPECGALLDTYEGIPEEKCAACALEWLRSPAKEENSNG